MKQFRPDEQPKKESNMRRAVSDEVLSIVRETVSTDTASVTLPSNAVEAMISRIDHQDKMLRAYRVLITCHDNYLCEVDKTAAVSEHFGRLEAVKQIMTELKI